jgi:hypothetical protein
LQKLSLKTFRVGAALRFVASHLRLLMLGRGEAAVLADDAREFDQRIFFRFNLVAVGNRVWHPARLRIATSHEIGPQTLAYRGTAAVSPH